MTLQLARMTLVLALLAALAAPVRASDQGAGQGADYSVDVFEAVKVKDDGNNLRAEGGPNYKQAAVLDVLNRGEHLQAYARSPGWVAVQLPDGRFGYIHENCLDQAVGSDGPHDLDPALRKKLERFLTQLDRAARTGSFAAVELLLHPDGVVINGHLFRDAAKPPESQARIVTPLWYATDVSLTWGSAWELLVAGTRPPKGMRTCWDEAAGDFGVLAPGMPENNSVGEAYPEQGLLPMHTRALALSPDAALVPGWPLVVQGYPQGETWREDYESAPFALVYNTGPGQYRLEQADHTGLVIYLEEYQGNLRLRGIATQAF